MIMLQFLLMMWIVMVMLLTSTLYFLIRWKKFSKKVTDESVLAVTKNLLTHPAKYVLNTIDVSPITIRPEIRRAGVGAKSNSNSITSLLQNIIKLNLSLPIDIKVNFATEKNEKLITLLQQYYYSMIRGAGAQSKKRTFTNNSNVPLKAIADFLGWKEWFYKKTSFRKKMSFDK